MQRPSVLAEDKNVNIVGLSCSLGNTSPSLSSGLGFAYSLTFERQIYGRDDVVYQ